MTISIDVAAGVPARRGQSVAGLKFAEAIIIPVAALMLSALLFSIFLLFLGKSPLMFFGLIWTGGFGSSFSFQNTLQRSAPLILTGLAFAIPARMCGANRGAERALGLAVWF